MLQRKRLIIEELVRRGACPYQELANLLGVSTMTIRRDVEALSPYRRVLKTLRSVQDAGAASTWYETDIRSRMTDHVGEKADIAQRALDLIQERQTLFLDAGTTCIQLAKKIASQCKGLAIVTTFVFIILLSNCVRFLDCDLEAEKPGSCLSVVPDKSKNTLVSERRA